MNYYIPMHTNAFYNPDTNELLTGIPSCYRTGNWQGLGSKKIAEAFTSVTSEERKMLWNSFNKRTYSFDFLMLNSKVRHKLRRLGLYQLREKNTLYDLNPGKELLKKINKKVKN